METAELVNGVLYSGCKTVKKILERIMLIVYGLKWLCLLLRESWDGLFIKKDFPDGNIVYLRTSFSLNTESDKFFVIFEIFTHPYLVAFYFGCPPIFQK